MLESNQAMEYEDPSKTFSGVYFVLLGFDLSSEEKIRLKLVDGGGIDVGRYGPDCTHVIIGKLIYDDPICVAALQEGKTLVTGLWVDHSFDIGMPVDPASIMYRPLRDLNGIPGAKSLVVCLTGYQRHVREDIMTMVGMMGASFSKPLVAHKVTHLICYKFEGDKYELAKKMKSIKLVNHRWLEDCLRDWELLPEADYDKSGHELEMMEAQAKDSEDEAEDVANRQHGDRGIVGTPQNSRCGGRSPFQSLVLKHGSSGNIHEVGASSGISDVGKTNETLLAREKEITPNRFHGERSIVVTPQNSRSGVRSPLQSTVLQHGASGSILDVGTSSGMSDVGKANETLLAGEKEITPNRAHQLETPNGCSKISGPIAPGVEGKLCSGATLNSRAKSSISETVGFDLACTSKTLNTPPSGTSKLQSVSYSRKTTSKASLPRHPGSTPVEDIGKLQVHDGLNTPSKVENEGSILDGAHISSMETLSLPEDAETVNLPEKRKLAVSTGRSKIQKTCHDSEGALVAKETEVPQPTSLTHGPHDIYAHLSPQNSYLGVNADLDPSPANIAGSVTPEIAKECSEKTRQRSSERLKSTSLHSKSPETTDIHFDKPENAVDDATEPQHGPRNLNRSSPEAERVEVQKSNVAANSRPKPLKRKLLAKKTLGSRSSFGRGKPLNQKGSIYRNEEVSPRNSAARAVGGKEIEDTDKFVDYEKETVPSNSGEDTEKFVDNVDQSNDVEMESLLECENQASNVDNEIEATEEHVICATVSRGVSGDTHTTNPACTSKETDSNVVDTKDQPLLSGRDETSTEAENVASDKGNELGELNLENNAGGEKTTSANKRPPLKSKKKNLPPVTKIAKSKQGEPRKEAKSKAKSDKPEGKKGKGSLDGHVKPRPEGIEMEKENRPVLIRDQNLSHNKQLVGKLIAKPDKKCTKTDDGNSGSVLAGQNLQVKMEPAWFILSGHRLQRKEFQQVIRRLKGRLCRDTHQWSYQATHFIVPDPLRRTEKFFAAAASGKWILKTDYLTACNESGKFLAEEPYEWHKNGLSEDGAINLEAPRKWRLLRERTGHGAFYGMRIIIYGNCIVPPLDTLKRVVKAGDGTILATSPPYSRFLESGVVDFAIVSPGMPRVDIWVQEFLRHEIPCVSADYLVEYVCKPGYSIDRHVQYNTHAWAKKSFKKLVNSMDEIAENLKDDGNGDIPCQVCGCRDRGEVMLICGDEGGSVGCGIGTHIDCCVPPLQEIPEGDWICSKCSSKVTQKKSSSKKKKR